VCSSDLRFSRFTRPQVTLQYAYAF
jgi:hypothetical protein